MIELIRAGKIDDALLFAQNELAPLGEQHPQFLAELERTMALLAFEMPVLTPTSNGSAPAPAPATTEGDKKSKKDKSKDAGLAMPESISSLLDQSQRLKTAVELNAAILRAQSHGKDPKLPGLLKMLVWAENLLTDKGVEYPKCKPISFHLSRSIML